MDIYDKDYFERGIETGKSCYQNYRWMPEATMAMAMTLIDLLDIRRGDTVLDYGCAKGFLVKALRLLGREAWGVDVSEYAIANVDPLVKDLCFLKPDLGYWKAGYVPSAKGFPELFDFCIVKDVFEHIPDDQLETALGWIQTKVLFAIIPLGDDGTFRAPANNIDVTHVTCHDEDWWKRALSRGWHVIDFDFKVEGIKDSYYGEWPEAHGFFTLIRRR